MARDIILENKSSIVESWVQTILASYPPEALKFLKNQKDRFANPVGYTLTTNAGKLFDAITGNSGHAEIRSLLDDMIRMRAVQDFSPSQAIGFLFSLKEIIRHEVTRRNAKPIEADLTEIDSRIDDMALIAFDLYMEARERLFRIRIDEAKTRSLQAITGEL